jgi:hypothetical protein
MVQIKVNSDIVNHSDKIKAKVEVNVDGDIKSKVIAILGTLGNLIDNAIQVGSKVKVYLQSATDAVNKSNDKQFIINK